MVLARLVSDRPNLSSTTTLGARILVRSKRGFVAFRDIR